MDSLKATEDYSAARSTHPRVSLADIENAMEYKFFTTADACDPEQLQDNISRALSMLTLCIIVMKNGFILVGKSAPASPENFDAEKGRTFAYEDAVRQLWPLMGYALKDKLAAS